MAEAILAAVAKIGLVGVNKAVEKLGQKVDGLMKLPDKIKMIEKELRMLNSVIQDLGSAHLSNKTVKEWITGVRNLAYHVEDVVDKYSYESLKLNEEDFMSRYIFNMGGARNALVFTKIVDEVAGIENELEQVKKLQSYWTNTIVPVKNDRAEIDRQRSGGIFQGIFLDEDLVGIEENRSKLTEWLSTDEKESTVITISGMGGLGKTTLVRNVYDREKPNFPGGQAWIVVSQTYDVVDLLTELLSKIGQPRPGSAKPDVFELTDAIQKTLQHKKCLIVLDDVWNEEAYTQMRGAFQGCQGSRVMITTRKDNIAALAHKDRRLAVQPLGKDESFKLFCSRAFHNTSPDPEGKCPPELRCPQELQELAALIADRCHGLPLAIVACGSLLSTKEQTEHSWQQMYNQLQSGLKENNHVQAILILSYHDLPGNLRNCFLYCSLFPEDYPMSRESLVRMWVAEGFVVKKDHSTAEEVAEENLLELIGRNMLEVVERDELSRVTTCKMHDIVRVLALDIAKDERYGAANDEGDMVSMDAEVRRFSTCGWKSDFNNRTAAPGVAFPRLRTVMSIASSTSMIPSILSGSNYLTVLELQDTAISELPETIGNLFNLRYIGLRRTNIQTLPPGIEKLTNLETLDIKQTKIEKLPPGIVKVQKLRHLFADRFADEKQSAFRYFVGVEAPKMISNCQDLQTIETVCASSDLSQQLRKMNKLQNIWIDNINASNCEELFDALSFMPLLSNVLLSATDEKEVLSFEKLKPISTRLTRLIVRGGAHGTLKFPIFQGAGKYLRYLALSCCNLGTEDPLQLLASQVPALTYLSLNRVSSAAILVLSTGCFPKLKTLVLKNMPNVNQLVFQDKAIPTIDGIYIVSLREMNLAPSGIECLGSLKKLWLLGLHKDFKADWDLKEMHNKLKRVPELRY